jgi:hypothetical protein
MAADLIILAVWLATSVAAGMFAHIRRDRNAAAWFFLALLFSPPMAFLFVAILKPKAPRPHDRGAIEQIAGLAVYEAVMAQSGDSAEALKAGYAAAARLVK